MPTGDNLILSASFDKDGEEAPGVATGILSLYYGDTKVGEGRIKTQPGKFSIAGEGLCVGRDSGEPVTDDYPAAPPCSFTGGTIKRVAVDVSGRALPRPRTRGRGHAGEGVSRGASGCATAAARACQNRLMRALRPEARRAGVW